MDGAGAAPRERREPAGVQAVKPSRPLNRHLLRACEAWRDMTAEIEAGVRELRARPWRPARLG